MTTDKETTEMDRPTKLCDRCGKDDALAVFWGDADTPSGECPGCGLDHSQGMALCVNCALSFTAPMVLTLLNAQMQKASETYDADEWPALMGAVHMAIANGHGDLLFADLSDERLADSVKVRAMFKASGLGEDWLITDDGDDTFHV